MPPARGAWRGCGRPTASCSRRLASELTLKHTPALTFEYDDTVDRGMRISQILDEDAER